MGVRMAFLEYLESRGAFAFPGLQVMDVGAQNLYTASPHEVTQFVKRHAPDFPDGELSVLAERLAEGGILLPEHRGFRNDSFLCDLILAAGISYTSLDIFERPHNLVVDLNFFSVPPEMKEKYGLVLNFGTTEHVFNQANCFQVIHDFTAVGGMMFHQVPSTGCVDHGYFVYCPQFFVDIARANGYDVVDIWCSGPAGTNTLFATIKHERDRMRDATLPGNLVDEWDRTTIPDSVVNVLLRKTRGGPFRLPLEVSTAVSSTADAVSANYTTDDQAAVRSRVKALEQRLDEPGLQWQEIVEVAKAHSDAFPGAPFPVAVEKRGLELIIAQYPDRDDLRERLAVLEGLSSHS